MGGYANKSASARRRGLRIRRTGLVTLLLAALMAMPALAAPPAESPAAVDLDRPVSTRPTALGGPPRADSRREGLHAVDAPPRTRAAARRHIEEMSPTEWLSQYGAVTIDPLSE